LLIQNVPFKDLLALLYIESAVSLADRNLCVFEGALVLAVQLADQEDDLENAAEAEVDLCSAVADVMLGQNQLCPELLDDPVAEIVVFVKVDLLPYLLLVEP
jgi:hypothetical protein